MKYEMINEELRIASCSLADLTLEQVKHFRSLRSNMPRYHVSWIRLYKTRLFVF